MSRKVGVLIGRFEGYHNEHHRHMRRAAKENDVVMVLIGSSNRRISIKNPFTVQERAEMIWNNIYEDDEIPETVPILFRSLPDNPLSDDEWAETVRHIVKQQAQADADVTLYGCDKDESTFYLKMFPEWGQSFVPQKSLFDASTLREAWFESYQTGFGCGKFYSGGKISKATLEFLENRKFNKDLQAEWDFYGKEKERFDDYPFPDTLSFSCGDAVVKWRDEILFIVRGKAPGAGCLALAGGFKNRNERFEDAAERELYEETRLNIPPAALAKCKVKSELFDDPKRSLGIPRATLAVLYDVTSMFEERPEVYPADDAVGYEWIKTKNLDDNATRIYDDHLFIVKKLLNN